MTFTTVFSTRFWRKANSLGVLLAACLLPVEIVQAEGISVSSAFIEPADESYQLSANFEVSFNQTIEDAINRGLSLPFIVEYEVTRPRWYWLDETVVKGSRSRQISYNALTRQYRLTIGSLFQNFERLEDVRQVLTFMRVIDLVEQGQLRKGTAYDVAIRMRLDVSRLPKPFQVNALTSRDWNLASDWYRFTYTP